MNSDFLFEHFGIFSSKNGWTVQKEMVEKVELGMELCGIVGKTVLNIHGCNINVWLGELEDPDNPPNELMLYCPSLTYNRHTAVLCRDHFWCTLQLDEPITEGALLSSCCVHLVYLGSGVYGQLRRKPYSQNLQDPIHEEYEALILMSKWGIGRPRKNPLNLSHERKHKGQVVDPMGISSSSTNLSADDHVYLH